MKKCFAGLLAVLILPLMVACESLNRPPSDALYIPVVYGTMKAIENSDSITAEDVLAWTDRARTIIEVDVDIAAKELATRLVEELLPPDISPADRFLVEELMKWIPDALNNYNIRNPNEPVAIATVLDWIEGAARMSGTQS